MNGLDLFSILIELEIDFSHKDVAISLLHKCSLVFFCAETIVCTPKHERQYFARNCTKIINWKSTRHSTMSINKYSRIEYRFEKVFSKNVMHEGGADKRPLFFLHNLNVRGNYVCSVQHKWQIKNASIDWSRKLKNYLTIVRLGNCAMPFDFGLSLINIVY